MTSLETPAVATFSLGSSDDSGAGRMALYFARGFQRRGWLVSAVCPEPVAGSASIVDRLVAEGVDVEVVPPFGGRLDRAVIRRFAEHFRRRKSRLVVSLHQQDMKFAGLAALRAGVPYVASGQNTFTFSGGRLRQLASRGVLGWILNRSCREVVATSDRVAGEFRRLLRFRGPVSILPNGVDTRPIREARPARDEVRRSLDHPQGALVVVSVGRTTRQKNQRELVEAVH
ncbi:MAG: glycosyltransferase, partial [Verrucomicrobiota bacterium]